MLRSLCRAAVIPLVCLALHAGSASAQPFFMGGAFTYQGQLQDGASPAAGPVDLVFRLYDAPTGGTQVGLIVGASGQTLVDGRFAATLDFNIVWDTSAKWLEIDVSPAGTNQWVTLSPRQQLTPVGQAIRSLRSDQAERATFSDNSGRFDNQLPAFYRDASNLAAGTLPSARLSGVYSGAVSFSNAGNTLAGSGAGLTGLNAAALASGTVADARLSSNVALLNGAQLFSGQNLFTNPANSFAGNGGNLTQLNASQLTIGVLPSARFSGTYTDAVLLTNPVNQFTGSGAGLILLNASNISSGTLGDLRLSSNVPRLNAAQTFSGVNNFVNASNSYSGDGSALTGLWKIGGNNTSGGLGPILGFTDGNPLYLYAGNQRALLLGAPRSATNFGLQTAVAPDIIGGYSGNSVVADFAGATIAGGGGTLNGIANPNIVNSTFGTVGGGVGNRAGWPGLGVVTYSATVAGGAFNNAAGIASTVSGGQSNTASGHHSTIPGGHSNTASGANAFAAGAGAFAEHNYTYVWNCNFGDIDFHSTDNFQYLIRATGGVGINTNAPGADLHVAGRAIVSTSLMVGSTNAPVAPLHVVGGLHLDNSSRDLTIQTGNVMQMGHYDGTTFVERVRMDTAGNVGIGTTAIGGNKLNVSGTFTASVKNFTIDHPLDPTNKYLVHSTVESDQYTTLYRGTVTLDDTGGAVVQLPEWFEALNEDFSYQLTAIGAPMPLLHVGAEVEHNRFEIAGGTPGKRASWMVTGVRKDAYAKEHPLTVEQDKGEFRGTYRHPEAHGAPAGMGEAKETATGERVAER